MIKKIFLYISILTSFIFCFLFGKYINTLAMGNFDNSIGTIPVQIDIDNYNTENILYLPGKQGTERNLNYKVEKGVITLNGTTNSEGNVIIINNLNLRLNRGVTYSYKGFYENIGSITGTTLFIGTGEWTNEIMFVIGDNNLQTFTPSNDIILNYLRIYVGNNQTYNNLIIKPVISTSSNIENFSSYFKFGYTASLSYLINSNTNTTVNYYFNDNTYTKTTNTVDSGYLIQDYYLPFNVDSKGYVSFPSINFGISSISNTTSANTYSLQLELTPVSSFYYKGDFTTNIYTKLNYMSNDLFFSGIFFSGCKSDSCLNNINAGNLSLTNPKILAVTEQNNSGNISTTNISTYYNDDIRNRNYFEFYNYLNVGFRVGDLAENYNFMNGRNYIFGISSLSSRIVDNQTTTTPLPDNELTVDKYNTCSAWYDIPCQLGNAVTYVIYEAPIISPVLSFIDSFITMFSSLVSFVDLFKSFGIVFGCFIIYMFIELLNKYSK